MGNRPRRICWLEASALALARRLAGPERRTRLQVFEVLEDLVRSRDLEAPQSAYGGLGVWGWSQRVQCFGSYRCFMSGGTMTEVEVRPSQEQRSEPWLQTCSRGRRTSAYGLQSQLGIAGSSPCLQIWVPMSASEHRLDETSLHAVANFLPSAATV